MEQFLVMIGQLFLITCIQSILEVYTADKKSIHMNRIITIACYLGSLYIVMQFTFQHLIRELSSFFVRMF